jgi:3-oxoacyl-[acyl-carrier-protein] synthase-3
LFGDGAGAVLMTRGDAHQGLVCYQLGSDGSGASLLDRKSGGSRHPSTFADLEDGLQYLHMDGRNVFKWAVRAVTQTIELVLQKSGLGVQDVSLYVLHQANIRIINKVAEHLGIPIALDEAYQRGRIHRGDTIVLSGFGAGLSWGTSLFRW